MAANGYNGVNGHNYERLPNMGEWSEYEQLVVSELERLNDSLSTLIRSYDENRLKTSVEIAELKLKSGLWGFLAGSIPIVIALLMQYLSKRF